MIIFDMDQTLVDTLPVEHLRRERRWSAVMSAVPRLQVYDGITPLLSELDAAGVPLAIVTKSPDMIARALIQRHRWPIGNVVGYHDVRRRKPDPEGLVLALKRAGAMACDSFHVGDQPEDTEASRAAGVRALGAAWGVVDSVTLEQSGPDELFSTVADLRAFLKERI